MTWESFGLILILVLCEPSNPVQYDSDDVMNAFKTVLDEYPYIVNIKRGEREQSCTGMLLDAETILTTSTCIKNGVPAKFEVSSAGKLTSDGESEMITHKVVAYRTHENFNKGKKMSADVALMKITPPADPTHTEYITLANDDPPDDNLCKVVSYGYAMRKDMGITDTRKLFATNVPFKPWNWCVVEYPLALDLTMCCAGFKKGLQLGPCIDATGGALVCWRGKEWKLAGIVSMLEVDTTLACGRPDRQGIYASVPALRNWINEKWDELRRVH